MRHVDYYHLTKSRCKISYSYLTFCDYCLINWIRIDSHMVTGIPPNQDADKFLASKNHPLKKFARKMKRRLSGGSKKNPRTKVYRHRTELPLDVNEVISSLTHFDSRRRCTVRNARNLPWIKEDKDDDDVADGESSVTALPCMKSGSPINFLHCSSSFAQ